MQKGLYLIVVSLIIVMFAACQKSDGFDTKDDTVFVYPSDGNNIESEFGVDGVFAITGDTDQINEIQKQTKTYPENAYKCNKDQDCRFHYSAMSMEVPCTSCDWGDQEWICLNADHSKKYFWDELEKIGNITCEICFESNIENFECVCNNNKCEKNSLEIEEAVDDNIDIYEPTYIESNIDLPMSTGEVINEERQYTGDMIPLYE